MDNFFFHNPVKIVFGKGMVQHTGAEISKYPVKKLLIVFGQSSAQKYGILNTVISELDKKNINHVLFGGIAPNPGLENVNKAIAISRRHNVDGILAIGGGSVIDTAKAVAVGHFYNGNIWDFFENNIVPENALPIFTVVTLSATASEMNPTAVITNEAENKKWSFAAGSLTMPKLSIIDPQLQVTVPAKQTVMGAVDSIAHILEYYFNGVENVDIQDEFSEGLVRTLVKHTQILLQTPDNYESRAQLAWCSVLAFNGLNAAGRFGGDFATHTIEHSLSAFYPNIHHAEGLAVILPNWMDYVASEKIEKFARFAANVFCCDTPGTEARAKKGIENLRRVFSSLGAPARLKQLGVKESDLEKIAGNAVLHGPIGRLKKLNKNDILHILVHSY
ncbi:MAG: iron-containing alcohol dehydrogenase [Bacteroidales bacterium]|nr:iron-containing alcohol dehydrogenase [Bacteroidales bacterium]